MKDKQYIIYYNNGTTKKVGEKEVYSNYNCETNFYAEDIHSFLWNDLLKRWETKRSF